MLVELNVSISVKLYLIKLSWPNSITFHHMNLFFMSWGYTFIGWKSCPQLNWSSSNEYFFLSVGYHHIFFKNCNWTVEK